MPVAATYSIAEVAAVFDCTTRWLTEQVRAGRFPAKKIGRHWRLTEQDIADALDACANDFHCAPSDVAMVTGLTPRSRRKVAGLWQPR
ncbi:helix-turn-helix domain-containing protein [Aldersonia sp. NBC_00410]|uniref:helix-turn-helix domain-containing protein n=1 Tax=Aldersonia sp. NBC_00410 TaxID=2975954 RepID=UPI00338E8625